MKKEPPRFGAASSKVLQIGGGKVLFQIVPAKVCVDHRVNLGGNRFFDPVRAGPGDSGLFLVHSIPSNGDSGLLLRLFLRIPVLVILSDFGEHAQGAQIDAGAVNGGLNVSGKRVPVCFHFRVLIFHTITAFRMSKWMKFITKIRKETKR